MIWDWGVGMSIVLGRVGMAGWSLAFSGERGLGGDKFIGGCCRGREQRD